MRRARRLWWVVLAFVPFGFVGWLGVIYAGARVHRRSWVALGAVYAAVLVAALVIDGPDGSFADDLSFGLALLTWAAQLVHTMVVEPPDTERMRAERAAQKREEARRLAREDEVRALELGIGRPDLPESFDGGLVDLNNAPAEAIASVSGVDRALADRIVAVREEIHGFSSLEDAAHVLELNAPLVDRIRRHVVVLPRGVDRV
jgi:hypothetical protein